MALLEDVKTSQKDFDLKWIVEREFGGNPHWWSDKSDQLWFEHGEGKFGWLGNETPSEENYYLKAAIVVPCQK